MKEKFFKRKVMNLLLGVLLLFYSAAYAENIDPYDDDSQYAYGENVGWLNAEPNGDGGDGVEVDDSELTGYIWGENIGWISLSCQNTSSCGSVDFGVENDGAGVLSGYAWGENVGWISLSCENTSSCGTVNYGVTIDGNGDFDGYAWGENIGWIHFKSESPVAYKVQSEWTFAQDDSDGDGFPDNEDNCPNQPNGPDGGTCVKTKADMIVSYRVGDPKQFITCTSDADCEPTGGTCDKNQGDNNGNGCGDVCECYMDCNNSGAGDGKVTGADLSLLKQEYGRFDCDNPDPCYADGNEDGKVTGSDLGLLKNEYGRFDCPACP